jgi:Flp pilus assembly protein TadD
LLKARTQVQEAVSHLSAAVRAAPTNAAFRNDLGYAYMLQGRFDLAQVEFTTAMQLNRKDKLSANNLIVLLLIEGRELDAAALAARADLTDTDWRRLKEQARGWSLAPG